MVENKTKMNVIIWFLIIAIELFIFVISDHMIIETPLGHVRGFETWLVILLKFMVSKSC